MDIIAALTEQFMKFPGVGPRQARRMVMFLLRARREWVERFVMDIAALRKTVRQCSACYRYVAHGTDMTPEQNLCSICASPGREQRLMIVEKDIDIENIERSRSFAGTYFVLGGLYAPLAKDPVGYMRLNELEMLVRKRLSGNVLAEIILALPVTPDGDETARVLAEKLNALLAEGECMVTRLGRGLSTGSELEYADPETIRNALHGRSAP